MSTGLNYTFNRLHFERTEHSFEGTRKLLHYFSPEITFSPPDQRDLQFVLRIHHRSSASGLFGCRKCGSNTVTIGLRKKF